MLEVTNTAELPSHVAIIMDGNRRWAKQQGLIAEQGHKAGYDQMKAVVDHAFDLGIKYVTVYAFSTENWKRSETEVSGIMKLARYVMDHEISRYKDRNVRVRVIGREIDWPKDIAAKIQNIHKDTEKCDGNIFNIAFSYGGKAEVIDAVNSLIASGEVITDENISKHLYTSGQPDPDLIIRTGGSPRLSNFLLWQSSYSEIHFVDTLWPDYSPAELDKSIEFYQNIKRNFGK